MAEFGFVGSAYQAASITQEDQACINWYLESAEAAGEFAGSPSTGIEGTRGVKALYPCPGLLSRLELGTGEVRGFHVRPGGQFLYAVKGNTLYQITTSYAQTSVGTLSTNAGPVFIRDNGTSLYITDGSFRYYYTWASSTFALISDGPFTGGGVCEEVDNFFLYTNPNTNNFGQTNVGDVISNPLSLGAILGSSGNLVALIADHRQVLLLGENYSERWINVGSFPLSFAIVPGSSIQHGLQAKNSVARLGEGIAFLALDSRGDATVVSWGAALAQPSRISTFAIENAIQGYSVTSDAIAYTYSQSGHEFYVLTFPTADVTWVYDLSTQQWHRRAWRDSNNVLHRHRSNCCAVFNGEIIVGDWQNGKIYALSQTTFTDDGNPLPCIRRARHLTSDLKRQYFQDLQIQFQPGVGLQSGQGSDPTCLLRWSDDGGFTWSSDHVLTLGKVGIYKNRAICRRLGQSRDRIFEIEVTDPVYRVVVSSNLNAQAGAS